MTVKADPKADPSLLFNTLYGTKSKGTLTDPNDCAGFQSNIVRSLIINTGMSAERVGIACCMDNMDNDYGLSAQFLLAYPLAP